MERFAATKTFQPTVSSASDTNTGKLVQGTEILAGHEDPVQKFDYHDQIRPAVTLRPKVELKEEVPEAKKQATPRYTW